MNTRMLVALVLILVGCVAVPWLGSTDARLPAMKVTDIYFRDSNHGFVQVLTLSRPETYETLDGGKTWRKTTTVSIAFRRGRTFANKLKGWSIDEKSSDRLRTEIYDTVYSTVDGGQTWMASFKSGVQGDFAAGGIQALSENEVWAVGISGAHHTTDGGRIWQKAGPPGTVIQFLNSKNGWIQDRNLWKSVDGGKTWTEVKLDGEPSFGGLGFFFLDEERGWSVYSVRDSIGDPYAERMSRVVVTQDGGKTGSVISEIPNETLWSVFFLNEREGWVGGIGSVFGTTDGGHTWRNLSSGKFVKPMNTEKAILDPRNDFGAELGFNLRTAIRLARLPGSGLPGIYQKPTELDKNGRIGFWFSLLVLLAERTQQEYPDVLEWDTQFVMGGRPGSSRRH